MIYVDFAKGFNLPPYWLNHPQVARIRESGKITEELKGEMLNVPHACPLSFSINGGSTWWQLPIEPVVSISGKNEIVRRNVLKQGNAEQIRGTIKELWSQDDYEITIAGILIDSEGNKLPDSDLKKLREICEHNKEILVQSPLFTIFNITRMVIESYELPFTKGIENQMFTIKGYSDELYDLVIQETQN